MKQQKPHFSNWSISIYRGQLAADKIDLGLPCMTGWIDGGLEDFLQFSQALYDNELLGAWYISESPDAM